MRFSLLVSVLFHLLILSALFFVFRVVPEMNLPQKIYSVKILRPIIRSQPQRQEVKTETVEKKPEVKKPEPVKPKEKKKPEPEEKKPEPKEVEKPLDVSVEGDTEEQTAMSVDAGRFPFSYYLEAVERKISQNWYSGVSSGTGGISCIVYFRLNRDGGASDVRIEQSSGNQYFDRTALRAVMNSAPFPPLPRAFEDSFLGIHFTFSQRD